MKKEICCINGCRSPIALTYYGKKICQAHFDKHCDGFIDLKKILKIKDKGMAIMSDMGQEEMDEKRQQKDLKGFCLPSVM